MQFATKTISPIDLHVTYKNKEIANTSNTKFLGLTLGNTFSWNNHVETILPKLCSTCPTVRAVKPFLSQESLRMIYFTYFHFIMTNGLVFWAILIIAMQFLNCKRELLELWWGLEAENISGN
jgi:hypothetical protein